MSAAHFETQRGRCAAQMESKVERKSIEHEQQHHVFPSACLAGFGTLPTYLSTSCAVQPVGEAASEKFTASDEMRRVERTRRLLSRDVFLTRQLRD
jgi:hypothetical protein